MSGRESRMRRNAFMGDVLRLAEELRLTDGELVSALLDEASVLAKRLLVLRVTKTNTESTSVSSASDQALTSEN